MSTRGTPGEAWDSGMTDTDTSDQVQLLRDLKQRSLEVDEARFQEDHSGYYLLGRMPEPADSDWSFATDVRVFDGGPSMGSRHHAGSPGGTERRLWRVEKTDRNTWKRRISVGRATNNDIVIRHDSISKLHAHFQLGALAKLRHLTASADLFLADAGSANGTFVEDRRLQEGVTAPVLIGDRVVFGDVRCELMDAVLLYKRLRSTPL